MTQDVGAAPLKTSPPPRSVWPRGGGSDAWATGNLELNSAGRDEGGGMRTLSRTQAVRETRALATAIAFAAALAALAIAVSGSGASKESREVARVVAAPKAAAAAAAP